MSQAQNQRSRLSRVHRGLPTGFRYFPAYLDGRATCELMEDLLETAGLETHHIKIFGRTCPMPRRIAWFGEQSYSYSGIQHPAKALPGQLRCLATQLETDLEQPFNCVLLNHYRTGEDSMGWHADNDYESGSHSIIASISLGATRRLRLRQKGDPGSSVGIDLDDGSLLVMGAGTQSTYEHAVPKTRVPVRDRLNLTFRWMKPA